MKTTLAILAITTLLCAAFVQCTTTTAGTAQALNPELYHQHGLLGEPMLCHTHCKQCQIGVITQGKCSNCGRKDK